MAACLRLRCATCQLLPFASRSITPASSRSIRYPLCCDRGLLNAVSAVPLNATTTNFCFYRVATLATRVSGGTPRSRGNEPERGRDASKIVHEVEEPSRRKFDQPALLPPIVAACHPWPSSCCHFSPVSDPWSRYRVAPARSGACTERPPPLTDLPPCGGLAWVNFLPRLGFCPDGSPIQHNASWNVQTPPGGPPSPPGPRRR
jgi:hypothetical protein